MEQVKAHKGGEPKPKRAVIVRQQEADEDKAAGESANDHFHRISVLLLVWVAQGDNTSFGGGTQTIDF